MFGFNYRLTDLQASVASVQLGKLDRFIAERERLATLTTPGCNGSPGRARRSAGGLPSRAAGLCRDGR